MRALIADPDAARRDGARGRAAAPRLRDRGARAARPRTPAGSTLVCLGGDDALAACRELAGGGRDRDPRRRHLARWRASRRAPPTCGSCAAGSTPASGSPTTSPACRPSTCASAASSRSCARRSTSTGTGFILTDPRLEDDPIVYVNQSFLEITGYTADEVLGRNCRFLQGRDTDPERVDELRRATRERRPATVELRNYRKDGTPFWNEVHISPVRDERGEVVRFVGVQVDVTAYREEQRRLVREQTARVAAQAAERRSAFLAEASPLLDASLDLRSTLDSLTRLSVPFLGDVCIVDEIHLNDVRRLAAAAADPAIERLVRELPSRYPVDPGDPIARVVETGRSEILTGADVVRPGGGGRGAPAGRLRPGRAARPAEGARAHHRHRRLRLAGPGPPLRHRGTAAGRGPRPPRGAGARQRAALRGPRRRRAGAAGGAAAAAAAGARGRRARGALPARGRRQPDRRRLLRRAAASTAASTS